MTIEITGRVIDRQTGGGATGLRVEAWDRAQVYPESVSSAITADDGTFQINLDEHNLNSTFPDHRVELFFKLFQQNGTEPLASTRHSAVWRLEDARGVIVTDKDTTDPDRNPKDFLLKDYDLRITYLTQHLTRMWQRFNFFVTIESALLGSKFLIGSGQLTAGLAWVGLGLSAVWYVVGAQDRFLVEVYRKQVERAARRVAEAVWPKNPMLAAAYGPIGEIEDTAKDIPWQLSGWRIPAISTTKLAALIPVVALLTWFIILIFLGMP